MELPRYVTSFMDTFRKNGYQIFLVGGAVRELLLNNKTENWDFTTNAKPEEILHLFPDGFYNNRFGTVGVTVQENETSHIFEVTTFRKEEDYTNYRHPEKIVWANDIKDDLARRDFTINAIAYDGNQLVDPYNGQEDLEKKIIQAVGEADKRFQEDALRLMRAIRFATTLQFTIDSATLSALKKNVSLITHISWERIRDELLKIISSEYAADGVLLMKEVGLLDYVLPEIMACFAVQQKSPQRHHIYDVGTHLIMSLKHCSSQDPITRLATLLHDIGKAKTYRKDPDTEIITFYNHEVVGEKMAKEIAQRLKLSKKQAHKLVTLIRQHQFTVSENQTDKAIRRFIREVSPEYLDDMLDLRLADRLGSGAKPSSWRFDLFKKRLVEVQQQPFSITDLKVNGEDVMKTLNIDPGPKVGEVLQKIFNDVEKGSVPNEREALLSKISDYS